MLPHGYFAILFRLLFCGEWIRNIRLGITGKRAECECLTPSSNEDEAEVQRLGSRHGCDWLSLSCLIMRPRMEVSVVAQRYGTACPLPVIVGRFAVSIFYASAGPMSIFSRL